MFKLMFNEQIVYSTPPESIFLPLCHNKKEGKDEKRKFKYENTQSHKHLERKKNYLILSILEYMMEIARKGKTHKSNKKKENR